MVRLSPLIALLLLAGCSSSTMPGCIINCTTVDDNTSVSGPNVRDYEKRQRLEQSKRGQSIW